MPKAFMMSSGSDLSVKLICWSAERSKILERSADQQINFTDKSDPEDIMKAFGISKGAFKRALGNLLKQGLIKQENGVTKLVKKSNWESLACFS